MVFYSWSLVVRRGHRSLPSIRLPLPTAEWPEDRTHPDAPGKCQHSTLWPDQTEQSLMALCSGGRGLSGTSHIPSELEPGQEVEAHGGLIRYPQCSLMLLQQRTPNVFTVYTFPRGNKNFSGDRRSLQESKNPERRGAGATPPLSAIMFFRPSSLALCRWPVISSWRCWQQVTCRMVSKPQ